MAENRYSLVGWLAIANAGIFPLAIVLNIVFAVVSAKLLGFYEPTFGPGDILSVVSTVIMIYILIKFKQLLHEHYQYGGIDGLIIASIIWNIAFEIGGIFLRVVQIGLGTGRDAEIFVAILSIAFLCVAVVSIGIIDIIIAVKLLTIKEQVGDAMKVFIYLNLVLGILEVSIVLSPVSLLLTPVMFIVFGIVFLRDKEQIQFV
ncbi:MAG: hypothetical protein ABIE70_08415 [bacterium]